MGQVKGFLSASPQILARSLELVGTKSGMQATQKRPFYPNADWVSFHPVSTRLPRNIRGRLSYNICNQIPQEIKGSKFES